MSYAWGHTRRYNDFGTYIRKKFNGRVQKISIHAGFTCPNRDGSKGIGGCTFCNNETFKPSYCQSSMSIFDQVEKGIKFFSQRYPATRFLAYFQAYTNTYGELNDLINTYEQALSHPDVTGLIIGTRPDCLPDGLIHYLSDLSKRSYVVVELGVESTSDLTLQNINRGHDYQSTIDAVHKLVDVGIPVGAHLILGLPGESREMMLKHAESVSKLPVTYLKIHQLQYVKGSHLGQLYFSKPENFKVFELNEYIELVVDFLELVRPDIVVERFASQAPHELLLAPRWGLKNFEIVHKVEQRMEERETWQGRLYR
ncbi:TIGR01212 family radical SAM protein [Alkalitalea saponilacus]|uniref:Radical SAM core domain-containing protein n=1 Tax=Alkalitalea saponilacus TaxID=889453 RepID=A0A1T5HB48_9BACT|nr:TIGR01212 family radical SAM protein [Alkalitalea saponilacus]ASB50779.1 TIGR01212 family radical SAM protein [Alkalitalea saponilacus]SKC17923.1 hypothetical protein SAMN03080601_02202 [Alkalitalea saponilacus]